jgi:dipicolinate synthase subunit A
MKDFIFLGGDLRFIYAAAKLGERFDCCVFGFDKLEEPIFPICRRIERAKNVILPLPMSRNCDFITAPYFSGKIPIDSVLDAVIKGGTVYCGKACPIMHKLCRDRSLKLVDYFEREELIVMNAAITAEGAVEIVMREKACAIMGMKILVTGYGRIAKVVSDYFSALGAEVTVCARNFADLAWAKIMGNNALHFNNLDEKLGQFDTIVNTVPAQIFDRSRLLLLHKDCLIVDLASKSCVEALEGVNVIWALSLPGKVAPITSGEIIADTILNIINENKERQT